LFAPQSVGSVAGLMGAVGSFGAMLFNLIVGVLLGRFHDYTVVFAIAGALHPISFVVLIATLGRVQRLDETHLVQELICPTNSLAR